MIVDVASEPAIPEPAEGGERELLLGWLAYQRAAFASKCSGLSPEQLRQRTIPPSPFSLLGLVRHLSEMERSYLRRAVGGERLPFIYCTEAEPDGDFDGVDEADVAAAFAVWRTEREHGDAAVRAVALLDATATRGEPSLRWNLLKLIAEYARHNGHADLLRERLDGRKSE